MIETKNIARRDGKITYSDGREETLEYGITEIKPNAYYSTKFEPHIVSVVLPCSVKTIGDSAFAFCFGMKSIEIPKSVTKIGDFAFQSCRNLESLNLSQYVDVLGMNPFANCKKLKINISPENKYYKVIDKSIYTKDGTQIISYIPREGENVFALPEGVSDIAPCSFKGCGTLENVHLPKSVKTIGKSAFINCDALTGCVIPEGVEKIENCAFMNCKTLSSITIPRSVKMVGYTVFYDCKALSEIRYRGSKAEWKKIIMGTDTRNTKVKISYNCE